MTTQYLVLARVVHFGVCLLFFGVFGFDRLVADAVVSRGPAATVAYWAGLVRWCSALSLALILLSGLAWFALVAMNMSGQPLQMDILKAVWSQTQFGTVWKIRLFLWFVAVAGVGLRSFFQKTSSLPKVWVWFELLVGALLLGSLAWAGHGTEGQPAVGHLFADVLHLLMAGFWPTGLVFFALLLRHLRRATETTRWVAITGLVGRFSALSLGSVAILSVTGFINSWYLVGSWTNLIEQPYGRWLLIKILLFFSTVAIGAVNLLRLKPRLLNENLTGPVAEVSAASLQVNVWCEIFLGILIVLVVAILGLMPPAIG